MAAGGGTGENAREAFGRMAAPMAVAEGFGDDKEFAADETAEGGLADLGGGLTEGRGAGGDDLGGELVGPVGGGGAGTTGVGEDMGAGEGIGAEEGEGVGGIGLGLAGETGDPVGTEAAVGERGADTVEQGTDAVGAVGTAGAAEEGVGTALDGEVEEGTEAVGIGGDETEDGVVVGHAGFEGTEAEAAGAGEVEFASLREYPIVALSPQRSPEGYRSQLHALLDGLPPERVYFCESVETAAVLAEGGFGAAVVPDLFRGREPGLVLLPIADAQPLSYGVYYKSLAEKPRRRAFVELTAEAFAAAVQEELVPEAGESIPHGDI